MKLDAKDFKRLQWAIAFLVLMGAVGGGSVWTALQMKKSGEKALKEATAARTDIQTKLARARDEQAELRDKIDRYQALQARGYIGPEQRLDWIEAIARIKVARRIFSLDYEFTPQRPVESAILPGGPTAGGLQFVSSQMRLQAQLLHEAELISLIEDIRNAVQALIQIRSCTIQRLPTSTTDRSNSAQIKAECTLEWITLKDGK
ncbi:MAG: hypothetical protein HZA63_07380 [Rhodocyclales bacterium]|nr:hypothetical protein [Rhodocyclales bacterium]